MGIFPKYDTKILSRYKKGADVRPEDEKVLNYWSSIGFVLWRYDCDPPLAKLSTICRRYL